MIVAISMNGPRRKLRTHFSGIEPMLGEPFAWWASDGQHHPCVLGRKRPSAEPRVVGGETGMISRTHARRVCAADMPSIATCVCVDSP